MHSVACSDIANIDIKLNRLHGSTQNNAAPNQSKATPTRDRANHLGKAKDPIIHQNKPSSHVKETSNDFTVPETQPRGSSQANSFINVKDPPKGQAEPEI